MKRETSIKKSYGLEFLLISKREGGDEKEDLERGENSIGEAEDPSILAKRRTPQKCRGCGTKVLKSLQEGGLTAGSVLYLKESSGGGGRWGYLGLQQFSAGRKKEKNRLPIEARPPS